jgi:acyl dehydratase
MPEGGVVSGEGQSRVFKAREERFGRFYEDLRVGDRFEHWPGKTITEADNHLFCLLTMAASPLHVDAVYAAREMEGGRNLVVGTYVYALLLGMSVPDISGLAIANLGVRELKHLRPTFHGDTLYAATEVIERRMSRSRPGEGIVHVRTAGRNQRDEVVCEFERGFLVQTRESTIREAGGHPV